MIYDERTTGKWRPCRKIEPPDEFGQSWYLTEDGETSLPRHDLIRRGENQLSKLVDGLVRTARFERVKIAAYAALVLSSAALAIVLLS
jgi:hypothetical protein